MSETPALPDLATDEELVVRVLRRSKMLLLDEGWTTGVFKRSNGDGTYARCAVGALRDAIHIEVGVRYYSVRGDRIYEKAKRTLRIAQSVHVYSIPSWNDHQPDKLPVIQGFANAIREAARAAREARDG